MKGRISMLQLVHLGEHGLFSFLGDARGFQSCRNRGKGGLPFAGLQGRLQWVRRENGRPQAVTLQARRTFGCEKSADSNQLAAQDP
ncbi:hypothetical protein PspLS_07883 [Pyricularia sp. CBS 133598]|nr:hypothetical protein PspLS_07883 [Pyricularia sp. CBS 133598]